MKLGFRNFAVILTVWAFVAVVVVVVQKTANPLFLIGAILLSWLLLLLYFRFTAFRETKKQSSEDKPSLFFKVAFIFFCGAIYGIRQEFMGGWTFDGIVTLIPPIAIAVWATRKGLSLMRQSKLGDRELLG
jgi:ABC-type transport system involved in cytochrome c biogenesis permease subunit